MILLSMVLALGLERALSHLESWREHALFERHVRWFHRSAPAAMWNTPWALLWLLGPTLLVTLAVQWLLADAVYGVLEFVFATLVLLLSLGPRDLGEEIHALLAAQENGDQAAVDRLRADLLSTPGRLTQACQGDDRRSVIAAICIQAHERSFAVLMWFFVLGPVGAVAYRIVSGLPRVLQDAGDSPRALEPATRLHGIMAWVPARITQVLYALAGSTDDALAERHRVLQTPAVNWVADTWRQLAVVGVGALCVQDDRGQSPPSRSLEASLEAVLGLRGRALLVLLALLALPTIGGWLG